LSCNTTQVIPALAARLCQHEHYDATASACFR
jgi:hypothetical protein